MPAKPHVTIADDNQTPTTAEQQTDTNWAQPVSVRDGHNAALGAKADTKVVDPNAPATEIGLLKGQLQVLNDTLAKLNATLTVSGTVGVNALPALPAGTAIIGKTGIDPAANTVTVGNFPATQAVSVADGSQVTVGTKADAAATDSTSPWTVVALLKGLRNLLAGVLGVKNVDGTGTELFTVANPAQVRLQSSGATGATAPASAAQMGGKTPGGTLEALSLDANKNQKVVATNSAGTPVENTEGILLASAARTTATSSPNQTNYNGRGVIVYLNVTAASGTGGVRVIIEGVDPATGQAFWLHASPAWVTAIGRWAYELYPGATTVAGSTSNLLANAFSGALPRTWKVGVEVSDSTSYTYSVSYSLIV